MGACTIVDGTDPATSILVKCGTAEVIAVHEVTGENDSGFKVDFLIIVPNAVVPDSGFVLQKVNSFDQLSRIGPSIAAYIQKVQGHLATRWAMV